MTESGQIPPIDSSPAWGELQAVVSYQFKNARFLRLAMTHPSISHDSGGLAEDNQRLEFLGDAVLSLILTRELYDRFPAEEEGPLTKARARMVNARSLAEMARRFELGRYLRLSHGEEQNGGRDRASALADAFEALVGAIYLDGGLEPASTFIRSVFGELLAGLNDLSGLDNPKGELQEFLQAQTNEAPQYELIAATGPDHDRSFESVVRHGGVELGRGRGKSKKAAESEAATVALRHLRNPETPS